MPEYTPPPADLSRLNPIQRYMQKGSLDRQDYVWLFIFVLIYFTARPYIQKFFRWWFDAGEIAAGEKTREDYNKRRAKAKIGANEIRGLSNEQESEAIEEKDGATGREVAEGKVVNRKTREKVVLDDADTDADPEWEQEPARKPVEGDKNDVVAWLNRWEKEES